jgi:hypothetical protein
MNGVRVMGLFFQLGNAIGGHFVLIIKIFPEIRDNFIIHGNFNVEVYHTVCGLCVNFTRSADRDPRVGVTGNIQNHVHACYYIGLFASFFIPKTIGRIWENLKKMIKNSELLVGE